MGLTRDRFVQGGDGGEQEWIIACCRHLATFPAFLLAPICLLNRKLLRCAECLGSLKQSRVSRRVLGALGAILREMTHQREALGVKHGNLFAYHLGQRGRSLDSTLRGLFGNEAKAIKLLVNYSNKKTGANIYWTTYFLIYCDEEQTSHQVY